MSIIHVEETALQRIHDLIAGERTHPDEALFLRIGIVGGGCSGFQYDFEFTEDKEDDDETLRYACGDGVVELLVDPISGQYLAGATLDFKKDIQGERFVMQNPHAKHQCGCGNSFSIDDPQDESL